MIAQAGHLIDAMVSDDIAQYLPHFLMPHLTYENSLFRCRENIAFILSTFMHNGSRRNWFRLSYLPIYKVIAYG